MRKVKDKERILKAAREKQLITYKGACMNVSWFQNTNAADQKGLTRNNQSDEKQGLITNITVPSKATI